jgi:predicted nucleic acid-binding protein
MTSSPAIGIVVRLPWSPAPVIRPEVSRRSGYKLPGDHSKEADFMTRYVIDAPTLLHLVDTGLAVDPSHQLVAPNSIRSEALQLLLHDVRAGQRTEAAALQAHERMTEIKMRLLGDRVSRRTAWQVAREHDWDTLRDAEYLAVTRLQADALVTVDPKLAAVAAQAVVALAAVDDLATPG